MAGANQNLPATTEEGYKDIANLKKVGLTDTEKEWNKQRNPEADGTDDSTVTEKQLSELKTPAVREIQKLVDDGLLMAEQGERYIAQINALQVTDQSVPPTETKDDDLLGEAKAAEVLEQISDGILDAALFLFVKGEGEMQKSGFMGLINNSKLPNEIEIGAQGEKLADALIKNLNIPSSGKHIIQQTCQELVQNGFLKGAERIRKEGGIITFKEIGKEEYKNLENIAAATPAISATTSTSSSETIPGNDPDEGQPVLSASGKIDSKFDLVKKATTPQERKTALANDMAQIRKLLTEQKWSSEGEKNEALAKWDTFKKGEYQNYKVIINDEKSSPEEILAAVERLERATEDFRKIANNSNLAAEKTGFFESKFESIMETIKGLFGDQKGFLISFLQGCLSWPFIGPLIGKYCRQLQNEQAPSDITEAFKGESRNDELVSKSTITLLLNQWDKEDSDHKKYPDFSSYLQYLKGKNQQKYENSGPKKMWIPEMLLEPAKAEESIKEPEYSTIKEGIEIEKQDKFGDILLLAERGDIVAAYPEMKQKVEDQKKLLTGTPEQIAKGTAAIDALIAVNTMKALGQRILLDRLNKDNKSALEAKNIKGIDPSKKEITLQEIGKTKKFEVKITVKDGGTSADERFTIAVGDKSKGDLKFEQLQGEALPAINTADDEAAAKELQLFK